MNSLQECRRFQAGKHEFLLLVPSNTIVGLDEVSSSAVLLLEEEGPLPTDEILQQLSGARPREEVLEALREMHSFGILLAADHPELAATPPLALPLRTLVLNVTNACNLSCGYCYEYGEDRLSNSPPRSMSAEVARRAVDFLLEYSGASQKVRLAFFGGETLLNFTLLRTTVEYAKQEASELGKQVDFSLTTNATLLTQDIIDYFAEERISVTVSIDGPREMNDRLRVFSSGRGSYDVIAPKIAELLRRHTTRPVGARVTLTAGVREVRKIFDHLIGLGFHEVGFAPVTTSCGRDYALTAEALDDVLKEFEALAEQFTQAALSNTYLGFSNLSDTLWELHHGFSKTYACGAGLGLLGVSPAGVLAPCHRFAESPAHCFGTLESGLDRKKQNAFLQHAHLSNKTACHTCWVRGLCSGGCYHEAYVRYGDTFHPNLHYCNWIRDWTEIALRAYARIYENNPQFLDTFKGRKDL